MNFNDVINKNKKKNKSKKKFDSVVHKILYYLIGIPLLKIEEVSKNIQKKYWLNNEDKAKKLVLNEMVSYITKDIAHYNCKSYYIFNTLKYDDIDGYDAIFIPEFLSYGPRKKYTKKTRLFNSIFIETHKKKEDYALYFYNLLEEHFKSFDDIKVEREVVNSWNREYECIKLKFT